MKLSNVFNVFLSIAVLMAISLNGFAEGADLARIAEDIRSGEIDVGKNYSMDTKDGRFHRIHADKLLLDCEFCHGKKFYKQDYLSADKEKPYPKKAGGHLEQGSCLSCHKEGSMGFTLYKGTTNNE